MVTVEALSPEQLLVTWRSPERDMWNGEILGYKIGYQKIPNNGHVTPKEQNQFYNYTRVGLSSGDGVHDFRLVNLDKYTMYLITVQAFNSKGTEYGRNNLSFFSIFFHESFSGNIFFDIQAMVQHVSRFNLVHWNPCHPNPRPANVLR